MVEIGEDSWISPECFRAYVDAEIKIPNTLIAVGPYVGHAALAPLGERDDVEEAVKRFGETFAFSPIQKSRASKTVVLIHRRFGIPVLPEGTDLRGRTDVRIFPHARFEVVYMEGVMNILEAILRLHGERGTTGFPRAPRVAELLTDRSRLAVTVAAFAAAESAVNAVDSTERSESFKERFNFVKSGEPPRAMVPEDKDGIQAELVPLMDAAVRRALAEGASDTSPDRVADFLRILTSPELHEEAA